MRGESPGSLAPRWANYGVVNNYTPLLAVLTGPVSGYFTQSITVLFIFAGLNRYTRNWTRNKMLCGILLFLFGFVMTGSGVIETIPSWLIGGAIAGCLFVAGYVLVLRYSARAILIAVGVVQVLGVVKQAAHAAYPVSLPGSVVAAVVVGVAMWLWYRKVGNVPRRRGEPSAVSRL